MTKTYSSWQAMRKRCLYKKHKSYFSYGGRGITVCKRWNKFKNFLFDMGERKPNTTIDRIDNNKGYCKENCRWATITEQASNRRKNRTIVFDKNKFTVKEISEKFKILPSTIYFKRNNGWSDNEILRIEKSPFYKKIDKRLILSKKLYTDGKSLREIGDILGVSHMTIKRDINNKL